MTESGEISELKKENNTEIPNLQDYSDNNKIIINEIDDNLLNIPEESKEKKIINHKIENENNNIINNKIKNEKNEEFKNFNIKEIDAISVILKNLSSARCVELLARLQFFYKNRVTSPAVRKEMIIEHFKVVIVHIEIKIKLNKIKLI